MTSCGAVRASAGDAGLGLRATSLADVGQTAMMDERDLQSRDKIRAHDGDFARGGEAESRESFVDGIGGAMSSLCVWRRTDCPVDSSRSEGGESAATVRARGRGSMHGLGVVAELGRGDGVLGCAGRFVGGGLSRWLDGFGLARGRAEDVLRSSQAGADVGGSEQAVVANLEELVRQDVKEEAADEFVRRERAGFLAAGTKRDSLVGDRDEPGRGDGDAMRVAAEVADDLRRTAEGLLGKDHPVVLFRLTDEPARLALGEIDRAGLAEVDEAFEELAAEDFGDGDYREQEVVVGEADPPCAVGAKPTGSDDRVEVRVEEHLASPGVKDEGEGWLRSEPFWISGEGLQGLRDRAEEEIEQAATVCVNDGPQGGREGEDDVEVGSVEEAALALLDPAVLGGSLTGGAMAVEAGVVEDDLPAAFVAAVEVPTEGRGAAALEVTQDACGSVGERMLVAIRSSEALEDLRDFDLRTRLGVPVHYALGWILVAIASRGEGVAAIVEVLTWT